MTYFTRSPLTLASPEIIDRPKRAGRSVVTSGATATGAAEATRTRAAVAKDDRRSLMVIVEWRDIWMEMEN